MAERSSQGDQEDRLGADVEAAILNHGWRAACGRSGISVRVRVPGNAIVRNRDRYCSLAALSQKLFAALQN
jgi:hypothetical protein